MRVLIVRHGPAGGAAAKAAYRGRDAERPLTAEGKDKVRKAARGLAKLVGRPDAIATSPFVRARQTAELVAARIGGRIEEIRELEPDADPRETVRWLGRRRDELITLVGHEPHLGRLIGLLCIGRAESLTELKKGQACLLELNRSRRRAKLIWSLAPAQLRKLA